jgi:phytol kinase
MGAVVMVGVLTPLSDNVNDAIATVVSFCGATLWLALLNYAAAHAWLHPTLSRKIIHIGTGPLFVLSWLLYSSSDHARYFSVMIPLILTAIFLATGIGWLNHPNLVKSSTRNGLPSELLRGPLYYGISFIFCTVVFWRESPSGILALMMLCGGDGLADVIGRRFGTHKLPLSPQKSWVGSLAMFIGSVGFGFGYLVLFHQTGGLPLAMPLGQVFIRVLAIAGIATIIEAMPFPDIDNMTLPLAVILLSQWLL